MPRSGQSLSVGLCLPSRDRFSLARLSNQPPCAIRRMASCFTIKVSTRRHSKASIIQPLAAACGAVCAMFKSTRSEGLATECRPTGPNADAAK